MFNENEKIMTTKERISDPIEPILFDVEKVQNTENVINPRHTHIIIGIINGIKAVLNYVAKRYILVHNKDIYLELEKLLSAYPKTKNFVREVRNYGNLSFLVRYTFPDFKKLIKGSTDEVMAGFDVWNSYDSSTVFGGSVFVWRQVCSNGMMGLAQILNIKNRHTESVKVAVQEMFVQAVQAIEEYEMQVAKYELLAERQHQSGWEERLVDVAKMAGIKKFHEDAKARVLEEIGLYGGVANDFLIYNALNWVIFNDDLNKKDYLNRTKMDEKVYATLLAN